MKKITLFSLFVFCANFVFGQVSYTTSCKIVNGKAYGYVHNHKNSFRINGNVWFYFYDCHGVYIESEEEHEFEFVSPRTTEEIEYTTAPRNACNCTFDVTKATDAINSFDNVPHNPHESDYSYSTSCKIKEGKAYGYVHNHKKGFTISGNVWFYFYDRNGQLIDSEDEHEFENVSARSVEEIEYTTAPSRACDCTFDVSQATEVGGYIPNPIQQNQINARNNRLQFQRPQPTIFYDTSCKIKDGRGIGFVQNYKKSFTINGNVWFYFYDCNGRLIDSEDEFEYEYVSAKSTEEIDDTRAPNGACSCTFEVKDAIRE